jgi:hypothetical protein
VALSVFLMPEEAMAQVMLVIRDAKKDEKRNGIKC